MSRLPTVPGRQPRTRGWRRFAGQRRALMAASAGSFMLALAALALPTAALADANSLAAYGATASGWALQPYVVNDAFLNVPAADQSAPYAFITMDNTPGARAKAAYLFPGTAINAVPNTQGVPITVPSGVEARYPGDGAATGQVGAFNDGVATQASAGTQSAQTSEGYALAQAALAGYQFAPTAFTVPAPGGPPPIAVPTLPPLPTSLTPTPTSAPSGSATATPTSGSGGSGSTATPTTPPTPCILPPLCLPSGSAPRTTSGLPLAARAPATAAAPVPVTLPDNVEQALATALKAAQLSNPTLLSLAGGKIASPNPSLPYASADAASQAVARATDSGVATEVYTRATNVQLFQGLIAFASVESTLQGMAPASSDNGSGTITTRITGATIGGIPVTVDDKGVTVSDQNASADQARALTDQLNAALAQANIHIEVIKPVTSAKTGFWQGSGAAVEVTAGFSPSATGLPSPASGLPGTAVDFTIAQVSANIYATPGHTSSDNSGFGDFGGGGFGFGFFSDNGTSTTGGGSTATGRGGGGTFSVLGGLSGGALLALVFVVQGLSAAAAAATAGYSDLAAQTGQIPVEEETR